MNNHCLIKFMSFYSLKNTALQISTKSKECIIVCHRLTDKKIKISITLLDVESIDNSLLN